jgi:hypothetical protein
MSGIRGLNPNRSAALTRSTQRDWSTNQSIDITRHARAPQDCRCDATNNDVSNFRRTQPGAQVSQHTLQRDKW